MTDVNTETLTLPTPDGDMATFLARPDDTPQGGVVVIQEAFGLTPHIEDVVRRVAAAGYLALAPTLFHRTGSPVLAYDGGMEAVRPHMQALGADGIRADLDASFGWLRAAGLVDGALGIVGFCMGGTVATAAAARYQLGAAVSFYGGGVSEGRFGFPPLCELAPSFRSPWLGLYGNADQSIPPDDVEAMRVGVEQAPVETDVVVYPGAQHGFHCDDRPAVFNPEAARAGWQLTLDFLAAHLR